MITAQIWTVNTKGSKLGYYDSIRWQDLYHELHIINLVGVHAAQTSAKMKTCFGTIQQLFVFFCKFYQQVGTFNKQIIIWA